MISSSSPCTRIVHETLAYFKSKVFRNPSMLLSVPIVTSISLAVFGPIGAVFGAVGTGAFYYRKVQAKREEQIPVCPLEPVAALEYMKAKISNPKDRAEIAKRCASHYGLETAKNFQKFQIEDEEDILKIAFLCLIPPDRIPPDRRIWGYMDEFTNGLNQENRIRLADFSANINLDWTRRVFNDFDIDDENVRLKFATRCAEKFPKDCIADMDDFFDIEDENARVQLILIAAKSAPREIVDNIGKANILRTRNLTTIATHCLNADPQYAKENISNFGRKTARIINLEYIRDELESRLKFFGPRGESPVDTPGKKCARAPNTIYHK